MKIGILICGKPTKDFIEELGDYRKIYSDFLSSNNHNFIYNYYLCYDNQLPDENDILITDCFIITGSSHSVYENIEWIANLKELIRKLDINKRKLIGICFGHQLIASALGCKVGKNPKGWEVSRCRIELNELGKTILKKNSIIHNKNYLYIQQMHKDIVMEINKLSGLEVFCYNDICNNQGMIKENHILTFQGHPEYFKDIIVKLLNQRRHIIENNIVDDGIKRSHLETDKNILLNLIIKFMNYTPCIFT
tara:strand:+ start:3727 stop:4476 length:750 start_codon:yes stop_codon:yes gene_type:complete